LEVDFTRTLSNGQKAEKKRTGKDRSAIHANSVLTLLLASDGRNVCILLVEAFDAASRIDEFLLASEERMAARADFDAQHITLDGRAGLERVPASTVYRNGVIVGMNTGFHESPFCRVRSARHPEELGTTAASLGHEANPNYRASERQGKICSGVSQRRGSE